MQKNLVNAERISSKTVLAKSADFAKDIGISKKRTLGLNKGCMEN